MQGNSLMARGNSTPNSYNSTANTAYSTANLKTGSQNTTRFGTNRKPKTHGADQHKQQHRQKTQLQTHHSHYLNPNQLHAGKVCSHAKIFQSDITSLSMKCLIHSSI